MKVPLAGVSWGMVGGQEMERDDESTTGAGDGSERLRVHSIDCARCRLLR